MGKKIKKTEKTLLYNYQAEVPSKCWFSLQIKADKGEWDVGKLKDEFAW